MDNFYFLFPSNICPFRDWNSFPVQICLLPRWAQDKFFPGHADEPERWTWEKVQVRRQPGRWKRWRADAASEVKFLQLLLLRLTNSCLLLHVLCVHKSSYETQSRCYNTQHGLPGRGQKRIASSCGWMEWSICSKLLLLSHFHLVEQLPEVCKGSCPFATSETGKFKMVF